MSKRDSYPPRTSSIGRVQGHNMQRTNISPAHEPLSAHPLLSPTPQSPYTPPADVPSPPSIAPAPAPRYVPYTPRQRTAPAPTTTTASSSAHTQSANQNAGSSSPQAPSPSATSKLQLVNLKAAAQGLGLDTGSMGWAVLERLTGAGGTPGGGDDEAEWAEIWNTVTAGKATLLLPLEPLTQHDRGRITPEFVKDHVVLCDGAPPSSGSSIHSGATGQEGKRTMITMSGMRGILNDESFTIRSTIHPTSKQYQTLLDPSTRGPAMVRLPPLPLLPSGSPIPPPSPSSPSSTTTKKSSSSSNSYPTYTLPTHATLPLPPRSVKPPLPPRPNARLPAAPGSPATSRISGFASLFGVKAGNSTPPPTPTPQITTPLLPPPSSASPVAPQPQSLGADPEQPTISVYAYAISTSISRPAVAKQISKALKAEINEALVPVAPGWVAERTIEFTSEFFPFIKPSGKGAGASKSMTLVAGKGASKGKDEAAVTAGKYVINEGSFGETMENLSERFQDFYSALEGDLRTSISSLFPPSHEKDGSEEKQDINVNETEKEKRERKSDESEDKLRGVMEVVERVICELLYDRLFLQSSSDDPIHDEALSSRVAALNMLDLSLEHLDVDVTVGGVKAIEGVDVVVRACGDTLTQLDAACRSPADKAAVLVAAHKVVVDGLSKLPAIKLKSEATSPSQKTPRTPERKAGPTVEDEKSSTGPIEAADTLVTSSASATLVSSPISEVPTLLVPDAHATDETLGTLTHASTIPSPLSLDARPSSPLLTISPPGTATPVSGDILLPLIIFSVVKANPPHLVSHLLYTQRFRNQSVGGEESYCMINLMAVAEFLENVDLGALGLGESEKKVISTADLTPIPIIRTPESPAFPSLRGRVEQQVDALAGSANKVLSGVVDTSFGVLRSFLPFPVNTTPAAPEVDIAESDIPPAPWTATKPGFGLLRRESGFSIASIAASLPGGKEKTKSLLGDGEESGQQLVSVSRPGSVKSTAGEGDDTSGSDEGDDDGSEEEEGGEGDDDAEADAATGHDGRSIRSFESMMSSSAKERKEAYARKSLSDRLAHMPGLSKLAQSEALKGSPSASRRSSLLPPAPINRFDTPISSRPQSPASLRLPAPNKRFVECHEDDLKISEVPELLREYKRLVEGVRVIGGFDE